LALPFVYIQSVSQFHTGWQRLDSAKPNAIDGLALVFEFEGQVFLANLSV